MTNDHQVRLIRPWWLYIHINHHRIASMKPAREIVKKRVVAFAAAQADLAQRLQAHRAFDASSAPALNHHAMAQAALRTRALRRAG